MTTAKANDYQYCTHPKPKGAYICLSCIQDWAATVTDDAQQATGEQQAAQWVADVTSALTAQPTDRGAESLGRLDAHGLAALRSIILTVIDDGDAACRNWRFYEGLDHTSSPDTWVTEAIANAQRLDFCDRIAEEIVRRAAPATATGASAAKGERP